MLPVSLPGAEPFDAATRERLAAALDVEAARSDDERGPAYTNRLVVEHGSFLRRQAHAPVDWRGWSADALADAARLQRPILLVIGFASCPGCHLLERETLSDPVFAELVNRRFVPVMVDRDERPDLDAVYMEVVKLRSGAGGWPAVVFLTSKGVPFQGYSYGAAAGSTRDLRSVVDTTLRELELGAEAIDMKAVELLERVRNVAAPRAQGDIAPAASVFASLLFQAAGIFDREDGGFGDSPRFVRPPLIDFLLRYRRRSAQASALEMAETTLEAVRESAVHDPVAGGFHRYARGPDWENPSYEKTLADNALLASLYLDGWRATGREDFRATARVTLDFLLRDLADPALPGAFDAGLDSESPGPDGEPCQGCFYRIGAGDRARALDSEQARAELLGQRAARPAPWRDDKVLADANGMALSALARGAAVFGSESYRASAVACGEFLLARMMPQSRPIHCLHGDGAGCPGGYLDDSVFMALGLLDLFEIDAQPRWLAAAMDLADDMLARFEHRGTGGFFFTSSSDDSSLFRSKPDFDGAQPSGNSAAVALLLRLEALTGQARYREAAARALGAFAHVLSYSVLAAPALASGLEAYVDSFKQILVLVPPGSDPAPLLAVIARAELFNRVLVVTPPGAAVSELARSIPALAGKTATGEQATAFVCEQHVCRPATTDPQVLAASLASVMPLPPD
ncbi:MAG: thioredoxin domain-containing protein [Deltaproteobacteria bacterium]|nr:thioredoxin domain-containing protein [Deltaproteobacteria bacterium]